MTIVKNISEGPRGLQDAAGMLVMLDPGKSAEVNLPAGSEPGDWFEFDGVVNPRAAVATSPDASAAVAALTERAELAEMQVEELQGELAALRRSAPVVAAAVAALDAKNNDHWTKAGEPAVDAVKAIVGGDVSRSDIEAAAPDAKRPS